MRERLVRAFSEPLVVFGCVALGLFVVDWVLFTGQSSEPPEEMVRALVGDFEQRVGRPPTEDETQGLRDQWSREEQLYQEGLSLGLDRRDPVVRRRVIAKMEALEGARMAAIAPDEAQLQQFFQERAEHYRRPVEVRYSLTWLDGSGGIIEHRASPHPTEGHTTATRLGSWFGPSVGTAAVEAEVGQPAVVDTPQGTASLQIHERSGGQVPTFDAVREMVLSDWRRDVRSGEVKP